MGRKQVWIWMLCLAPLAALAAEPYVAVEQRLTAEQRKATGIDTLSPQQLALLNRLLSEDRAEAVQAASQAATQAAQVEAQTEAAQVAAATAATAATAAAASTAAATDTQRDPDPSRYLGLEQETITSRVKGTVSGWAPGTEFALENGQVWKVLKGSRTLDEPMESPEILVVPGMAGRWFLQVQEDLPKARVYRID